MQKITAAALTALSTLSLQAGGNVSPVMDIYPKNFYIGAGLTAHQSYLNGNSDWFGDSPAGYIGETGEGLQAQLGYTFYKTPGFSVTAEARVAQTFWNFSDTFANSDMLTYSGLIKPEFDIGNTWGVYGLIGYGSTELTTQNVKATSDGLVYGGGVSYAVCSAGDIVVDYVVNPSFNLKNKPDLENDVISVGFNYKF